MWERPTSWEIYPWRQERSSSKNCRQAGSRVLTVSHLPPCSSPRGSDRWVSGSGCSTSSRFFLRSGLRFVQNAHFNPCRVSLAVCLNFWSRVSLSANIPISIDPSVWGRSSHHHPSIPANLCSCYQALSPTSEQRYLHVWSFHRVRRGSRRTAGWRNREDNKTSTFILGFFELIILVLLLSIKEGEAVWTVLGKSVRRVLKLGFMGSIIGK